MANPRVLKNGNKLAKEDLTLVCGYRSMGTFACKIEPGVPVLIKNWQLLYTTCQHISNDFS